MTELRRRESLMGEPSQSPKDLNDEIVREAQNPILEGAPRASDAETSVKTASTPRSDAVLDSRLFGVTGENRVSDNTGIVRDACLR